LAAPGPLSQKDDVLAWFQRATARQQQLAYSLAGVEPPAGIEALHEGVREAVSEGASLSGRLIELLSAAGPDFSIATDLAAHP